MGLADECCVVTGFLQMVADRGHIFGQFAADGPATMRRGIHAGDDGRARRRTDGVVAVSAIEARALSAKAIEIGRADLGVVDAERAPVLLVAGDEKNIGGRHEA